jgi:hypothetical protein
MKALTFFVLLFFVFKSSAQEIDSIQKNFSDNEKIVLIDTIYLDTLIIDNERKKFTSKMWIAKYNADEIFFKQTIFNKTDKKLELRATGNFVPEYQKEVKSLGYAKISYRLHLKGRKGGMSKGGTITYKPNDSNDSESKQMTVILMGLKEYEKTITLDTLYISDTTQISYASDFQFKSNEEVMFKLILKNLTKDTVKVTTSSDEGTAITIYDFPKIILSPNEIGYVYLRPKTWSIQGKFSDGINIVYLPVSKKDSVRKIITRMVNGQINE